MSPLPHRRPQAWVALDLARRPPVRVVPGSVDALIADLAKRQAGLVARFQLLTAGVTPKQIATRLRSGRLHVVRPGLYAVGQRALSPVGEAWSSVLAGGPDALLGGWTAGVLTGVVGRRPSIPVTLVVPPDVQRAPRGLRVRRLVVRPWEQWWIDGLPVMSPARAVLECAASDGPLAAERLWRGYVHHGLLDLDAVAAVVESHDGEAGAPKLRALLSRRSELLGASDTAHEEHVARLVRAAGFPEPERNRRVVLSSGRVVSFDLCLPEHRLAIEADGPYHRDPEVAAEDAARDADAARDGWTTVRAADDEPDAVVDRRLVEQRLRILGGECGSASLCGT